jgi:hypothetical protein
MLRIRLLSLVALLFSTKAYSACSPTGAVELQQHLDRSSQAIGRDDLILHGATVRELKEALPCLTVQLPTSEWAAFLVGLSIVEFATGRDWKPLLNTAYRIDPHLRIDYGPPELRQYLPKREVSEMRALARDGTYFLDGLPLTEVGEIEGLHIVQRFANGSWETRVLNNGGFPEEWLAPKPIEATPVPGATTSSTTIPTTEPKKKGAGLLIAGSIMAVAGTAGGIGTYMVLTNAQYPSPKQQSTMTAANIASWSVAITGVGLGVVGILTTPQASRPLQLGFSGNGIQLQGVLP